MSSYSQFFGGGGGGSSEPTAINSYATYTFGAVDNNPPGWNSRQRKFIDPTSGAVYLETGTTELVSGSSFPNATKTPTYQVTNNFVDYRSEIAAPANPTQVLVDDTGSMHLRNGNTLYRYQATAPFGYTGKTTALNIGASAPGTYTTGQFIMQSSQGNIANSYIRVQDYEGTLLQNITVRSGGWPYGSTPGFTNFGAAQLDRDGKEVIQVLYGNNPTFQLSYNFQRTSSADPFGGGAVFPDTVRDKTFLGAPADRKFINTPVNDFHMVVTGELTTGSLVNTTIDVANLVGGPVTSQDGDKGSDNIWALYNATASLLEPLDAVGLPTEKTDSDTSQLLYIRIQ